MASPETSFGDLGLSSRLVEALGSEGIESPTDFQEEAIPVVRRGNNLIGRAGPGAGTLLAYGAPLLDRLEPAGEGPRAVCLAPTHERATGLARSLAPLARSTGHAVAALDGAWARPERADVLFGTPGEVLDGVRGSRLKLDGIEALVVDGAGTVRDLVGFEPVETLAEFVPPDAQRVVLSLPLPEELDSFLEGHVKRAVHVPPRPADREEDTGDGIPRRGTLRYRIVEGDRRDAAVRTVGRLREEGARHVLLHVRTADRAERMAGVLRDHGYAAGEPGDPDPPVWLGTDPRRTRRMLADRSGGDGGVATLSLTVPPDPDTLDQRHAEGRTGVTLLRGRELPHLRATARIAGYALEALPEPAPAGMTGEIARFRERLRDALDREDLAPHLLLLEPLIERAGAGPVAAAAAALLRGTAVPGGRSREGAAATEPATKRPEGPAWVRLFISLGHRDDAGPGDILGAITGEVGIDGSKVGRIDIRDTFSLVEVDPAVAEKVIRTMNGITVRGRSIRVDFDRGGPRRRGGRQQGRGRSGSRERS